MRNLMWQSDAWQEYLEFQSNKTMLKRINLLLKDVMRNGYDASYGKVELLKGDFTGYASIRIDQKNRIIFEADESMVVVIQFGNHYKDH